MRGFPGGSVVKRLPANAGDAGHTGSIPESERFPGGGNGIPLQYSSLENAMDGGAWWAAVHRVTESDTTEATECAPIHIAHTCTHTYLKSENSKFSFYLYFIVM